MFARFGLFYVGGNVFISSINKSLLKFSKLKQPHRLPSKTYCSHIANYESLLRDPAVQKYLDRKCENLSELATNEQTSFHYSQLLKLFDQRNELRSNLGALIDLENENSNDVDVNAGIKEERHIYSKELLKTEYQIIETCLAENENSPCKGVLFEISPGVGGQEAMLFAKTLYDMYCRYAEFKGWDYNVADVDVSHLGGIRNASLLVEGSNAYSYLKFESGVHRVQRVPATERAGRVHTSTVTVAVIPQPADVNVVLNEKDLIVETKRSSGAGGQHVNTTDSAVRITHVPTGFVVECQTDRSQIKNRVMALARLKAKLYEQKLNESISSVRCTRKSQVGIGARSDKIRTYNYHHDRITDHRLSGNIYSLPTFFKGGQTLDDLINNLIDESLKDRFNSFISQIKNESV